jgi:predicted Zn-dependent protease
MMRPTLLARLLALAALATMIAQPAAAQSILRDAETEDLLQDLVDPLVEAAGMPKGAVDVVLINDPSINAFVAGGQRIYVHSGLINAATTANEVQGVLAHELGHITGGHVISNYDAAGKAMKISLLTTLLGVAAAVAGAGEVGMGAMALGQQAAMGNYLSYRRDQEASADAAGAQYLGGSGITGKGSLAFFGRLQNEEFRRGYSQGDDATYMRTHPLSGDRMSRLEADYRADPAWDVAPDGEQQRRFERIKAKLFGYLAKPAQTLNSYPQTLTDVPARYARAYAFHKDARMDQAMAEVDALAATAPDDPYFLELRGQILLESGKPDEALVPLRRAVQLTGNDPLIASTFGHALLATEDKSHLDEAEQVLRAAVGKDRENPFAWYQLGIVYGSRGDIPRAQLASAEQQIMNGLPREALRNAQAAERSLPIESPDWIRAQDVAMQAREALEREQRRN